MLPAAVPPVTNISPEGDFVPNLALLSVFAVAVAPTDAAPMIGDAAALAAWSAALIQAGEAPPPHGNLRFTCRERNVREKTDGTNEQTEQLCEGRVRWSPAGVRWDFREDYAAPSIPGGGERPLTLKNERDLAYVQTDRAAIAWDRTNHKVTTRPTRTQLPMRVRRVRPHDSWYLYSLGGKRTWGELLDAERGIPDRYTVTRDGANITAVLDYGSGTRLTVTGDVTGPTITSVEDEPGQESYERDALRAEWAQDAGGFWYPETMTRESVGLRPNHEGIRFDEFWEMTIHESNSQDRPPNALFDLDEFDLAPGTEIIYRDRDDEVIRTREIPLPADPDARADEIIRRLSERNASGTFADGEDDEEDEP